jgi:hypothetical protein
VVVAEADKVVLLKVDLMALEAVAVAVAVTFLLAH